MKCSRCLLRIIIKSTLRAEALRRKTGAPIDGFLQNTLETLFRLSRLEMHSKWCYNICICSVILGELKSFRNYKSLQALQYYFPENVRCNLTFYESENFSDSSLHHILESENFRFPFHFSKKNCVTWVIKYETFIFYYPGYTIFLRKMKRKRLNFRKSQRIYQISFENITWMDRQSRNLNRPQAKDNSRQYICFSGRQRFYRKRLVPLGRSKNLSS